MPRTAAPARRASTAAPARRTSTALATDTRLEEGLLSTALKKLVRQEQSRTQALREYAEAMVTLRLKLSKQLDIGLADVPRSKPYREAVTRAYDRAGVEEDAVPAGTSRAALGAAIRYHVAEVMREKGLAAEAGIALDSPSQRLAGARMALAAKRAQDGDGARPDLGGLLDWLSGIDSPAAVDLDLLDRLEAEVTRLRALAGKRRRRRSA